METNFKGTKGIVFESQQMVQTKEEFICDMISLDSVFEANKNLIVDAFNVRQQINFDLPELLRQRNEMLEVLNNMLDEWKETGISENSLSNHICKIKFLIKEANKTEQL